MYHMYTERKNCIFCKSAKLLKTFGKNLIIPVGSYNLEKPNEKYEYIPFNIVCCTDCQAYQTLYLGDLNEIYKINHADGYGSIRSSMNSDFSDLIKDSISDIDGIVEIGAGGGALSDNILAKINTNYTIIDPFYFGPTLNRNVIRSFLENTDLDDVDANTLVMSHVFEHFYLAQVTIFLNIFNTIYL